MQKVGYAIHIWHRQLAQPISGGSRNTASVMDLSTKFLDDRICRPSTLLKLDDTK